MKKRVSIIVVLVMIISISTIGLFSGKTHAKSAQLSLAVPDSVKKEDEFTVHVQLDSDVDLYSIDAYLKYDESLMEFVPDTECVTGSAGILEIKDVFPEETRTKEYDITFKAIETGKSEIALTEVYLIDYADMDFVEVIPSAVDVDIQMNRSEDMDIRLADLLVAPGTLEEEFRSDLFEYEMHVGLDVEEIGVSATALEESSVVESEIPEKLQVGENIVTVKVTSLSGNVGVYTIHIYREDIEVVEDETEEIEEQESFSDEEITQEVAQPDEQQEVSDTEMQDAENEEQVPETTTEVEEQDESTETATE